MITPIITMTEPTLLIINAYQGMTIKCGLSKGQPMPYYKYEAQSVLENSYYKLHSQYDMSVITDLSIHNNRLNIIILDRNINETYLTDVAIPISHNLRSIISEKFQKNTHLKEEQ
jgi:hypothetical protein